MKENWNSVAFDTGAENKTFEEQYRSVDQLANAISKASEKGVQKTRPTKYMVDGSLQFEVVVSGCIGELTRMTPTIGVGYTMLVTCHHIIANVVESW